MKTAEDFFTQKNGGKTAEELLSEGVLISPILAVRLMEQYHEARMKEEWISVKDKLPDDNKDYQVWEKGSIIATSAHYLTKKYFLDNYDDETYMDEGWYYSFKYPFDDHIQHDEPLDVTHWMPLLTPPKD